MTRVTKRPSPHRSHRSHRSLSTASDALDQGWALPSSWYTSREVFERERERVFRGAWQYAGLVEQIGAPGDYFTVEQGGVPLVVTRDLAGEPHALVNVCRHRGSIVAPDSCGHRATLQCPYHAWTYDLDGALRKARGMEDEPGFDRSDFALPQARLAAWGPFLFVSLERDAPPLADVLGELPALVGATGIDLSAIRRRVRREMEIAANWKVVIDNYLECYHCPVAHPAFCDLIDVSDYHVTEYDYFSTQTGAVKDSARRGQGKHAYDASAGVAQGFYAYLWPNFTLNIYPGPGNVSLNLFVPLALDRTLAVYDYCFADSVSAGESERFTRFIDQVQDEDKALCESVQRGLATGTLDRGRLMLTRESALRHFQRLVARFGEE